MSKDMIPKNMDSISMIESPLSKIKRHSWPTQTTPCPPYWPQNKIWQITQKPKVQFIQQPTYPVKPVYQSSWQSSNPWQQSSASKNNDWPMLSNPWAISSTGWSKPVTNQWPAASIGWSKSAHGWQASNWQLSDWQPKVTLQKPAQTYLPQYQKTTYNHVPKYQNNLIKPVSAPIDCPPYQHEHSPKIGVVYAPEHKYPIQSFNKYYHNEPQYVKLSKPIYHAPPSTYLPPPSYNRPKIPQIDVCDK
ncbi:PREDICTED: uncharacterized protein LOC105359616 [Ceratosolen solmsi marchali]|uniref:Uncharacterized protein LOC105359616 n=1 Tax=Ceratosolen solmsi marchali TaxID=326594 RepID=A0AAJ6YBN8_9HYME|nr:PREDICTED: uncharacterized protein LOC105359616 [Ceratosolen solmsi marchali]